jgi:beta-lactamase class A
MQRRQLIQGLGLTSALLSVAPLSVAESSNRIPTALKRMRARFPDVVNAPEKFRLQIAASWQLNGHWHHERFRLGAEFFAPASMVKLPITLMAIKRVQDLGLGLSTQLRVINPPTCAAQSDEITRFESFERTIQRILIVSDNGAFNRFYEFVGGDRVSSMLHRFGFGLNNRIQARLGSCAADDNAQGRGYELAAAGNLLVQDRYEPIIQIVAPQDGLSKLVGNAYLDWQENKIDAPKDFSASNHYRLKDMHALTLAIAGAAAHPLWDALTPDHQAFVRKTMSTLPREAGFDEKEYPDGWGKFFLHGDQKTRFPAGLKITNKIGQAYGFLTDSAWIQTPKAEAVFSATIYVNADGILNDDQYDYDSIGFPFLAELGRQLL